MGEEAGYEMREVIMRISGETSCSGTWLAFSLTQAFILQSLSFYSALSSALGTEDVIGNHHIPSPEAFTIQWEGRTSKQVVPVHCAQCHCRGECRGPWE